MRFQASAAAGISLVESLFALAATALLTAVITPVAVESVHWLRLKTAAGDLAREVQRARLLALSESRSVSVHVDPESNSYRLTTPGVPALVRGARRVLPPGIRFERIPSRPLVLHPWGTAAPAGSYVLAGKVGRLRVLVHLTGRVRVEEAAP